jgi:hypothetical protein
VLRRSDQRDRSDFSCCYVLLIALVLPWIWLIVLDRLLRRTR